MGFKPVERKEKKKRLNESWRKNSKTSNLRKIYIYDSYKIFVKLNERFRKIFEKFLSLNVTKTEFSGKSREQVLFGNPTDS